MKRLVSFCALPVFAAALALGQTTDQPSRTDQPRTDQSYRSDTNRPATGEDRRGGGNWGWLGLLGLAGLAGLGGRRAATYDTTTRDYRDIRRSA